MKVVSGINWRLPPQVSSMKVEVNSSFWMARELAQVSHVALTRSKGHDIHQYSGWHGIVREKVFRSDLSIGVMPQLSVPGTQEQVTSVIRGPR